MIEDSVGHCFAQTFAEAQGINFGASESVT